MNVTSSVVVDESDVSGRECMHITYCESHDKKDDALFVKEYIHMNDGEVIPNFKMIENFERSFWVTKPARRNHKDKLQWEELENCTEYRCREIDLLRRADLALGNSGYVNSKRQLFKSPYLWGCGVKPQSLLKYGYATKYPDTKSKLARVGVIDTETDVLNGTGNIIMGAFTFKTKAILAIDRHFFGNTPDEIIEQRFLVKLEEILGDVIRERNIDVELKLVNNDGEVSKAMLDRAHEWQPDFVTFWNMDFDIPKMMDSLTRNGFDLADCFSDPKVPEKYRFFKYTPGSSVKKIHDGTTMSINPEQRWHIAQCPASFFLMDAMTSYWRLRIAAGMEEGYSLEAVLQRNLNIGKVEIEEVAHLDGIDRHKEMQTNYKYEYAVYCLFDSISTEMLDEETGDISVKVPAMCKYSDFTDFKSGPTRIADEMHYHCLEQGYVFGVTDGDIRDENDDFILKSVDWIITLPAYMGNNLGIDFIEG